MISIILPNLDTPLNYLEERVASIRAQTATDWECIIVDGYSKNGSWKYLCQVAAKDDRFKAHQFKKEGIYKAWNSGIGLAKGEFVYIATSDDTMSPGFLEKMVQSLNSFPECAIAHCNLTIIDEQSRRSTEADWDQFYPAQYFGDLLHKRHIRMAPYDGILHCGIKTVYTSITQLLIRRSVFDRVGLFLTDHGSMADFEWGMRASLACNVLHVPEYLATWRRHDLQATQDSMQDQVTTYQTYRFFIRHAFKADRKKRLLSNDPFSIPYLEEIFLQKELILQLSLHKSVPGRMKIYLIYLLKSPGMAIRYLYNWNVKKYVKKDVSWIQEKIRVYKLDDHLKKV